MMFLNHINPLRLMLLLLYKLWSLICKFLLTTLSVHTWKELPREVFCSTKKIQYFLMKLLVFPSCLVKKIIIELVLNGSLVRRIRGHEGWEIEWGDGIKGYSPWYFILNDLADLWRKEREVHDGESTIVNLTKSLSKRSLLLST